MENVRVVTDVACTACGCVCDDLKISVRDNKVVNIEPGCPLAERHFLLPDLRAVGDVAIQGSATSFTEGVTRAATILRNSRSPLIYGLSRSSTDGQRWATSLADFLGGTIDTTASTCHAPSIMAVQQVGESTCSLGEIRNRADLVLFWGSNPVDSHPRHLERYALEPEGMFVPNGRQDRSLVVVDVQQTATADQADLFLRVEPGRDFEVLWALRSLLQGKVPTGDSAGGLPMATLSDLADRLKSCRCGVVFFGRGIARGPTGHLNVEALLRLVTDLNAFTRFHARRMRIYGDVAGADSVLCWRTGFPFSVNLARGYPRYNPGEYSAEALLERGEVDACVLVGSEGVIALSAKAQARLAQIPRIVLDYPGVAPPWTPDVLFTTAIYGMHLRGTAYRMDEIPVPLRAFLDTHGPSDADVLGAIEMLLRN